MTRKMSNPGERGYPAAFRREVCESVDAIGLEPTIAKYRVAHNTVRRWRRALGFKKLGRWLKTEQKAIAG